MSWKNIKLILHREVRDQMRDRRTLFMVAVLPLLLYPVLGIAMVQMLSTYSEQTRTVVLLGAEDLPDPSPIDGDRFREVYFDDPLDADKLRVVTEGFVDAEPSERDAELRAFVLEALARREQIEELARLTEAVDETAEPELVDRQQLLKTEIGDWFNRSPVEVLIVIPAGYGDQLVELNSALARRDADLTRFEGPPAPIILENGAIDKSAIAYRRVSEALHNWEDQLLEARLAQARLPQFLHTPFDATDVDLAASDQLAASVWSKLFPTLLVIMAVTGAFYPAIDVGAGEKERGTMETLLICPATRSEIVIGKFLTVMGFSLATALLNLLSMGFTGKYMLEMTGAPSLTHFGDVSFPPLTSLVWLIVLAVPIASMFSALSLAFAMFARSSKEGQYYLTPLLLVTLGLTVFCLNPAVEITPYYSILPVTGPALLLKALLLGASNPIDLSLYFLPVLVSSFAYSAVALWWAIDLFQREDILFREAERFELRLWIKHVLRDRGPLPNFAEAGLCFTIILILQFLSFSTVGRAYRAATENEQTVRLLQVQIAFLVATVAAPAVLMAAVLTSRFRETLKLVMPSGEMLGMAVVLPLTLLPLSQELMHLFAGFFPDLPKGFAVMMEAMGDKALPIWLPLAAFALAPAICEELAFRGFILSGMQHSGRRWLPILLSSAAFGIVHLVTQQVFNAMLLGLVLGLLATRGGSLIPCILFHFIFNGVQVALSRVDLTTFSDRVWPWLVSVEHVEQTATLRYEWPLLGLCAAVATMLIYRLVRPDNSSVSVSRRRPPQVDAAEHSGHPRVAAPTHVEV